MPKIELIVTDLDGTFTTNKYEFCPENARAVRAAQQNGIRVCACTARNWGLAKGQVRRAGFDNWTITCNGASLVDNKTGLPVARTRLAPKDVEKLLQIGVRRDARVAIYTNEQILFLDGYAADHYAAYPGHWETVDRDLAIPVTRCRSVLEMAVLGAESSELVEIMKPGGIVLDEEECDFMKRFSISGLNGPCIFVMQHGISKLSGVRQLAGLLNVPRENVMAVGDNENDVEMLRWAGIGVAVEDGDKMAKAAADYVTGPHDKAGFYQAVMDIALSGQTM